MSVGDLALSGDSEGRYLLVADGSGLTILNTKNLVHAIKPQTEIMLEGAVQGIGVTDDNSV